MADFNPNNAPHYYYYNNLGFDKVKSWSEKDISQFLLLDYFDSLTGIMESKDFEEMFLKQHEFLVRKYNQYKFPLFFWDKLFLSLYLIGNAKNSKQRGKSILFRNLKYPSIVSDVKKQYHVGLIATGKQDRFFARKNLIGYISFTDLYQDILSYLEKKDAKYLYRLLEKVEARLKIVKPDYIIMSPDSLPIERAIVLAAKKLGIATIAIQHALYGPSFQMFDCEVADYILVWGKYYKDLYLERKIRNPEDIYILGYPRPIKKNTNFKKERKTVCYLGQSYEKYNTDLLKIKIESVKAIYKICKDLDLEFVYRPHPGDDVKMLQEKMPDIKFSPSESLEETFEKADIFIAVSSTALIEASMRSKICIQLMNVPLKIENFEELGVCNKSFKTTEEIKEYLIKMANAENLNELRQEFNNDYIETRYNPSQRFLEIMEKIEERKSFTMGDLSYKIK